LELLFFYVAKNKVFGGVLAQEGYRVKNVYQQD